MKRYDIGQVDTGIGLHSAMVERESGSYVRYEDAQAEINKRDKLLNMLVGDDEYIIEENPDEGNYCFYCGGKVDINRVVYHASDCIVLEAREILKESEE